MSDTIAAVSTPFGEGGISIIRISGNEAIEIADKIFKAADGKKLINVETHTIHYGFVKDSQGKTIDEVLVSVMKKPHTFTAEDVVEINCHGGIYVTKRVLNEVLSAGAHAAQPGEFTKRAFLNGRIDLTKAEAVIDIINAENENQLKCSQAQLGGSLYERIEEIRSNILDHIAFMEAAMDDPENISMENHISELSNDISKFKNSLNSLIETFNGGKIIKDGINTVIAGCTNAGKSSLLNLLTGEDSAIVTDIEGTTRDTISERINLDGICLNITDTAGIRHTTDAVEKLGVEKALQHVENASLVLHVIDASKKPGENDKKIAQKIKNKNVIVILNKADLQESVTHKDIEVLFEQNPENLPKIISFSTKTGKGLRELSLVIKEMFNLGKITESNAPVIINERHKILLEKALNSLQMTEEGIQKNIHDDLLTVDLMDAYESLGLIIGKEIEEDLADRIFEKFCMGK